MTDFKKYWWIYLIIVIIICLVELKIFWNEFTSTGELNELNFNHEYVLERTNFVEVKNNKWTDKNIYFISGYYVDDEQNIQIKGAKPDAKYWSFTLYDQSGKILKGGGGRNKTGIYTWLNGKNIKTEKGNNVYNIIISPKKNDDYKNWLNCSKIRNGYVVMRCFDPKNPKEIVPPTIEVIPVVESTKG